MKYLVTGANGFVGKKLCAFLSELGHVVVKCVRKTDQVSNNIELNEKSSESHIMAAMADIDCVIHLAANVHAVEDDSIETRALYELTNVKFTERIADAAKQTKVKRLVFVSSIGVIGSDSKSERYTETTVPCPQNLYAKSKWEAEKILHDVQRTGELEVVIVRPVLVYGEEVKANFLNLMTAIYKGWPLPFGSLTNKRSFLYIGNFVSALATCSTHAAAAGQTYHISDGEPILITTLLKKIGEVMGRKTRLFPIPTKCLVWFGIVIGQRQRVSSITNNLVVDSSRITKELGWLPNYTSEEGIYNTVKWFQNKSSDL